MEDKDRYAWIPYSFATALGLIFLWGAVSHFTTADPLVATVSVAVSGLLLWFLLTPFKTFREYFFKSLVLIVGIIYTGGTLLMMAGLVLAIPAIYVTRLVEDGNYWGASLLGTATAVIFIYAVYAYTKPHVQKVRSQIRNGTFRFW